MRGKTDLFIEGIGGLLTPSPRPSWNAVSVVSFIDPGHHDLAVSRPQGRLQVGSRGSCEYTRSVSFWMAVSSYTLSLKLPLQHIWWQ